MFLRRILSVASFRLAATYLAIFTLSVGLLGAVVYWRVDREFARANDERVLAEAASLQDCFREQGLDKLADLVRARAGAAGALDYRLEDGAGLLLAGDGPSARSPDGKIGEGWVALPDLDNDSVSEGEADRERGLVTRLDGGAVLIVGEELKRCPRRQACDPRRFRLGAGGDSRSGGGGRPCARRVIPASHRRDDEDGGRHYRG